MQAIDFFEHVVVFSQHEWIGEADQVALPARLRTSRRLLMRLLDMMHLH